MEEGKVHPTGKQGMFMHQWKIFLDMSITGIQFCFISNILQWELLEIKIQEA